MSSVIDSVVSTVLGKVGAEASSRRFIIGVSGPQGSGKTTVTQAAAKQLQDTHKISTLALSLDDYYLPHEELQAIAKQGNPLLQHRGLPGTHDTALLRQFCDDFLNSGNVDGLTVPVYDKSLHSGAGDRVGLAKIPRNCQVVLLEGWMLGFRPLPIEEITGKAQFVANATLNPSEDNISEINSSLGGYVPIWNCIHLWARLVPASLDYIYTWRLSQEHKMIASKGSGMTDAQVSAFVDQYMPCYKLYTSTLDKLPGDTLAFELNIDHQATRITQM